jgi:hypothetical protein
MFEINDNRLVTVNEQEQNKGFFVRIDQTGIPDEELLPILFMRYLLSVF